MLFAPFTRRDAMCEGSGGGGGGNAAKIADVGFNTRERIQGFASQVSTGYHKGMTIINVVVAFAIVVIATVARVLPAPAARTNDDAEVGLLAKSHWTVLAWVGGIGGGAAATETGNGYGQWQQRRVALAAGGGVFIGVHDIPPPTPYPADGGCG